MSSDKYYDAAPGLPDVLILPDGFQEQILDDAPPFGIGLEIPAGLLSEPERLLRLARINAYVPANNADKIPETHAVTLENYIKLALHAAGDRATLHTFLERVLTILDSPISGKEPLAQQVLWIWAPAADIAGLGQLKPDLEDSAFKILMPERYAEIDNTFASEWLNNRDETLNKAKEEIELVLNVLGLSGKYELQAKPKNIYGIYQKQEKPGRVKTKITDLLGMRIILDLEDEESAKALCYTVIGSIAADWYGTSEELEDYIRNPRLTGYQSLHQIFYLPGGQCVELQVRTRRMHEKAANDPRTSHLTYDAAYKPVPGNVLPKSGGIKDYYRWRTAAAEYIEHTGGRTEGLLGNNILFFKADGHSIGNLYMMESGGNLLDASFHIHTERAFNTHAATQNGRPHRALTSKVAHGDVLGFEYETQTLDDGRIDSLLKTAATRRTKEIIHKAWRDLHAPEYLLLGKKIIAAMAAETGITDPLALLSEQDSQVIFRRTSVTSLDGLLAKIGMDNKIPGSVMFRILRKAGIAADAASSRELANRIPLKDQAVVDTIVIPGINRDIKCIVAGCCSGHIKLGDEVCARASRKHNAMKLHLVECEHVANKPGVIYCGWS